MSLLCLSCRLHRCRCGEDFLAPTVQLAGKIVARRKTATLPQLQFFMVVHIPVALQSLIPMVSLAMEIPQLPVDTVIDVPVVQVRRVPQVPSWRSLLCSHSCTW